MHIKNKKGTQGVAEIEALIQAGKLSDAQKALEVFFLQPLSDKEQGKIYADLLTSYIDIVNSANQEYMHALKNALDHIKEIHAREKKAGDTITLAEVRANLT